MNRSSIWIYGIVAVVCFAGGFLFANFLNRSELTNLRGENERLKTDQTSSRQNAQDVTLTEDEITQKLKEAEENRDNFAFQKSLGLGLYRYGAIKQEPSIIERAVPVLLRANALKPDDYDVVVGLGNAYYDIGFFRKDNTGFDRSREFYKIALAKRPDDIEVRTDLGLTYFLQDPPDLMAAIAEFERSLAVDPKHEKTLSFAALSMKKAGLDPSKYAAVLRSVNPDNPTLKELTSPTQPPPLSQ